MKWHLCVPPSCCLSGSLFGIGSFNFPEFCANPILEKILFLRFRPKVFSKSDWRVFKSAIFPEEIDEMPSLFACWYKFTKIKSWPKIFFFFFVKNGCGQFSLWTVKLTVPQEWTDGINGFLHAGKNSGKMAQLVGSWDPKICCILRMNLCIELIFWMQTVVC